MIQVSTPRLFSTFKHFCTVYRATWSIATVYLWPLKSLLKMEIHYIRRGPPKFFGRSWYCLTSCLANRMLGLFVWAYLKINFSWKPYLASSARSLPDQAKSFSTNCKYVLNFSLFYCFLESLNLIEISEIKIEFFIINLWEKIFQNSIVAKVLTIILH